MSEQLRDGLGFTTVQSHHPMIWYHTSEM